jgi:DNA-binding transcriptional MerR regulator
MDTRTTFRSSQLAKAAGVSTDTLRYYERNRLLPGIARASNGYRCYPPDALDRVLLIRRALGLGFSVEELARILKARDSGGAPCQTVRTLANNKLEQVETQMKELKRFRKELRAVLRDWDQRLARRDGRPARLLEGMTASPRKPGNALRRKNSA